MNSSTLVTQSTTQEVTGQSAFWVLITLAGAAVCQPTHTRLDTVFFGGNISLTRALPSICLWDGIVDVYALCKAIREGRRTSGQDVAPVTLPRHTAAKRIRARLKPNVVMVKLAIALIAVLPQTIKILSMRGIPGTQFAASIFFFASATRLIVELTGLETYRNLPVILPERAHWKNPSFVLFYLIVMSQIYSWLWIWYNIGFLLKIDISEYIYVRLAFTSIELITKIAAIAQGILWARGIVVHWSQGDPAPPRILSAVGVLLPVSVHILTSPINQAASTSVPSFVIKANAISDRILYAAFLAFCAASASFVAAGLLDLLGRKIAERNYAEDTYLGGDDTAPGTSQETDVALTGQTTDTAAHVAQESDTADRSLAQRIKAVLMRPIFSVLYSAHVVNSGLDHRVMSFVRMNSLASNIVAITIFNIVTTVCYYLVRFDGTGTTSPAWTSILG
ncbi:hypothetical protein PFICI_00069 [Pestalotiopsis fici W106-1]|uniref:Uncharacterized protein n=1 Tax=Pestalotiopsis fici (strain W106-1 / CGMCC3.15140) TaxID=1229662 RepID=W3XLX1_PESFW|nr:uncharacterized protein PFICI_00069 [Pestalotiopsis fici W106-1]ETS86241.1 hypothetical protein PFICI_00069 [Pestalotiopsis fici W106-1]